MKIKIVHFSLVTDFLSINCMSSVSAAEHILVRSCVFKKFIFCCVYLTLKYNLKLWSEREEIWLCGRIHVLSIDIISHGEVVHNWTFILRLVNLGNDIKSSTIDRVVRATLLAEKSRITLSPYISGGNKDESMESLLHSFQWMYLKMDIINNRLWLCETIINWLF